MIKSIWNTKNLIDSLKNEDIPSEINQPSDSLLNDENINHPEDNLYDDSSSVDEYTNLSLPAVSID